MCCVTNVSYSFFESLSLITVMIYDCFLFNNELDLLEVRIAFLFNTVDYFVIAESRQTFSGLPKRLYFKENEQRYIDYQSKIIHLEIPETPLLGDWETEYFQRDYIHSVIDKCHDDDLVVISDLDEIPNLDGVMKEVKIQEPTILVMNSYYYYLNFKTNEKWYYPLIAPCKMLRNFNVGNRRNFVDLRPAVFESSSIYGGWHFSYLFGNDILKYVSKIKSFSHQEYNTAYYLNPDRIRKCFSRGIDIFERAGFKIDKVDLSREFTPSLLSAFSQLNLLERLVKK